MDTATDVAEPWTPDTLFALLPEDVDWRRFEIVDGALVVSPTAVPAHELMVARLVVALTGSVTPGFAVIGSAGIELGRSYRVPDVTVLAKHVFVDGTTTVSPADVLLAVEVESPSSVTTDRITKPAQYAAAGIRHYWRLETDPLRLITYSLSGDVYAETGSWGAGENAQIAEPFPAELDLDALTFVP